MKKPVVSTSAPKNGAERVVNGRKEVYDEVFGWIADSSGGEDTYIDNELTGEYVGEMGYPQIWQGLPIQGSRMM